MSTVIQHDDLLKIDLRVAHVGGGQLKIHGLWKNVQFMNHGQPFRTLDIVVGDFRVMTCEGLLMGGRVKDPLSGDLARPV
jgi:hypothetical protein